MVRSNFASPYEMVLILNLAFIFQIFQIAAIVSGSTYMVVFLAPIIAIAYAVQYGYLRTSRQLRHLDLESRTPLYTLFTENAEGLLFIRAYGWQEHKLQSGFERLDVVTKTLLHAIFSAAMAWISVGFAGDGDCGRLGDSGAEVAQHNLRGGVWPVFLSRHRVEPDSFGLYTLLDALGNHHWRHLAAAFILARDAS